MPYTFSMQRRNLKNVYCMTSRDSGKTYCYPSQEARRKGIKMHKMFKNMPKSKIRVAQKK